MYPSALCGVQGDLNPPDGGWGKAPVLPWNLARADDGRNRARAARCISSTRFPEMPHRLMRQAPASSRSMRRLPPATCPTRPSPAADLANEIVPNHRGRIEFNHATTSNGSAAWDSTLSNCVIYANYGSSVSGSCYGGAVGNSTVYDSEIYGNSCEVTL